MPYRRLPNTDSARLRALKAAYAKCDGIPPQEVPIKQSTLSELRQVYPEFEQAMINQMAAQQNQVSKNKGYAELYRKAKLYISHFVQVMNFAIMRGDLQPKARTFFGIDINDKRVPALQTEKEVLDWGERIMKGEPDRIANGGNPITNPTVAIVRVRYEQFLNAYRSQKSLQITTQRANEKISSLRSKVDTVILHIWDEVENSFEHLSSDEKRERAKDYGLIYYYRLNEKDEVVDENSFSEQNDILQEFMDNNNLAEQRFNVFSDTESHHDEEESTAKDLQYSFFFSNES
ncbi:MAG: hypothetical protein JXR58_03170 [Bacteroidales bacterium]|nr:hypothetical protein [Bacteroidales bacterium]